MEGYNQWDVKIVDTSFYGIDGIIHGSPEFVEVSLF